MSICKDDKSYLKNNLISFLTSVKEKLLYTVCHEIPCNASKISNTFTPCERVANISMVTY